MLAEAGRSGPSEPRRDPEEVALELLQTELGARRIDGG
jgi:DNA polymerase-3 subunit gamma/tau